MIKTVTSFFKTLLDVFVVLLVVVVFIAVPYVSYNIQDFLPPKTYSLSRFKLESQLKQSIQKAYKTKGIIVEKLTLDSSYSFWDKKFTCGKIATFVAVLTTRESTGKNTYKVNVQCDGNNLKWTILDFTAEAPIAPH